MMVTICTEHTHSPKLRRILLLLYGSDNFLGVCIFVCFEVNVLTKMSVWANQPTVHSIGESRGKCGAVKKQIPTKKKEKKAFLLLSTRAQIFSVSPMWDYKVRLCFKLVEVFFLCTM